MQHACTSSTPTPSLLSVQGWVSFSDGTQHLALQSCPSLTHARLHQCLICRVTWAGRTCSIYSIPFLSSHPCLSVLVPSCLAGQAGLRVQLITYVVLRQSFLFWRSHFRDCLVSFDIIPFLWRPLPSARRRQQWRAVGRQRSPRPQCRVVMRWQRQTVPTITRASGGPMPSLGMLSAASGFAVYRHWRRQTHVA